MFERYTQPSRHVIFLARDEAANYGSRHIESEHLLLGVITADNAIAERLAKDNMTELQIRAEIEKRTNRGEPLQTVEIPLSRECAKILRLAAKSADQLGHEMVEPEHLLLAILRVEDCLAAQILRPKSP